MSWLTATTVTRGGIWNDRPSAAELRRRFDAFPGIGQKKAAMAVEILERDLHVPLSDLAGSDIAYDVHVRRVFLRAGLAQRDDVTEMVAIARKRCIQSDQANSTTLRGTSGAAGAIPEAPSAPVPAGDRLSPSYRTRQHSEGSLIHAPSSCQATRSGHAISLWWSV